MQTCRLINPDSEDKIIEFADRYVNSFHWSVREEYAKEAREIAEAYRGALIETLKAGERFFYPSQEENVCAGFPKGSMIDVTVDFACCDGDPNPPCLLGFAEFFLSVSARRQ